MAYRFKTGDRIKLRKDFWDKYRTVKAGAEGMVTKRPKRNTGANYSVQFKGYAYDVVINTRLIELSASEGIYLESV